MRECYEPGHKFDCALACYAYERYLMHGDFGDDEIICEGSGDWYSRYGKRVLFGDDRGFVGITNPATVDASVLMTTIRHELAMEEEYDD